MPVFPSELQASSVSGGKLDLSCCRRSHVLSSHTHNMLALYLLWVWLDPFPMHHGPPERSPRVMVRTPVHKSTLIFAHACSLSHQIHLQPEVWRSN